MARGGIETRQPLPYILDELCGGARVERSVVRYAGCHGPPVVPADLAIIGCRPVAAAGEVIDRRSVIVDDAGPGRRRRVESREVRNLLLRHNEFRQRNEPAG